MIQNVFRIWWIITTKDNQILTTHLIYFGKIDLDQNGIG